MDKTIRESLLYRIVRNISMLMQLKYLLIYSLIIFDLKGCFHETSTSSKFNPPGS